MTYLYFLLPPVVIIISAALILFVLSRKSFDLDVINPGKEKKDFSPKFSSMKQGLLGLLEKNARFVKLVSLKIHNRIEKWLREIKEKKALAKDNKVKAVTFEKEGAETQGQVLGEGNDSSFTKEEHIFKRTSKRVIPKMKQLDFPRTISRIPGMGRKKVEKTEEMESETEKEIEIEKEERKMMEAFQKRKDIPMISEDAVYPEKREKKIESKKLERMLVERIAQDPRDIEAYERLGVYYEEVENFDDALECFRHVLKLSPGHERAEKRIARLEALNK